MGQTARNRNRDTLLRPRAVRIAPAQREFIVLGGRPVVSMSSNRKEVHETQSVSAAEFSSIELLATVATCSPECVVVLRHKEEGLALALRRGKVVGAFGTGARGSMQTWSKAARTQELQRCREDSAGLGVGLVKMFVERCTLEHLPLIHEVGARLSILRGDAKWIGSTLEEEHAPSLQFLLMELAREVDDCTKLQPKLEPLTRYVVPASSPEERAGERHLRAVPEDELDFGDLDEEDESERQVLREVWQLCNGRTTMESLLEQSLHGRARTLRALDELQREGCIELYPRPVVQSNDAPKSRPGPVGLSRLAVLYPDASAREAAIERFIGDVPLWLAELEASVEARTLDACLDACGPLMDSAYAVAASAFVEELAAVTRMLHAGHWTQVELAMEPLAGMFGEAFRVLVDFRAK